MHGDADPGCGPVSGAVGPRVWFTALLLAAVMTIVTAAASHLLLQAGLRHSQPTLEDNSRTGAAAVGMAVAGQFARAFELGIPLDRLVGAESYLKRIVESSPSVSGLALIDAQGRTIAATNDDVRGQSFAVGGGDIEATIVVADASPLFEQSMRRLSAALAVASILAGAVAGVLTAGYLTLSQQSSRRQLVEMLERAERGDFAHPASFDRRGPFAAAANAFSGLVARVEAARQRLAEAVATIRAIDFDGSLGKGADAVLEPLDRRYTLPDPERHERIELEAPDQAGGVARVALVLGLYAASMPILANFAADRGSLVVGPQWVPVLPFLMELALAAAGAAFGVARASRSSLLRLGSLVVLGAATAATFWCRDFEQFVLLRALAGLSAGVAIAGLSAGLPRTAPPRTQALLLVFASLVVAPALAGLIGEAIGRRATFLVVGCLVLLATPLLVGPHQARPASDRVGLFGRTDPGTWIAALPVAALLLIHIPTGVGYDNYFVGGLATAAAGLGLLLGIGAPGVAGVPAAALAAAALAYGAAEQDATIALAAAALGIALGGALAGPGASAGKLRGLMAGCGCGLLLAGLFGPSTLALAAAAAVAAVALALLLPGRRRRPANMDL